MVLLLDDQINPKGSNPVFEILKDIFPPSNFARTFLIWLISLCRVFGHLLTTYFTSLV